MLEVAVIAISFLISLSLTGAVRRYALKTGLIDVPNPRSSHETATPRGGGAAIVAALCLACVALVAAGFTDWRAVAICCGPGAMVAVVGYADDRRNLSARIRFVVHMIAAAIVVSLAWPLPELGAVSTGIQVLSVLVAVIGIGWMINLFNFMDGIDGLAASEATFVLGAAAMLVWQTGGSSYWVALLGAGASSTAGFLWWNWPPARIFMGDVGSGFLGFVIGGFALVTWKEGLLPLATWVILVSLFVADATVTLVRRMIRGEKWYAAHRIHAYQWVSRSPLRHTGVTWLSWVWNMAVIAPVAYWSVTVPAEANLLAAVTLLVSVILVLFLGAGRPE